MTPFTLACYMVEGGGSDDFRRIKAMLYERPDLLHHLLDVNTRAVIAYLNAQIEAGAQAVMVFDTWGGILSPSVYEGFTLQYMRAVMQGVHSTYHGARIPKILYAKGAASWLEQLADTGADALGLDWTVDLKSARARVGDRVAIQGNLDPAVLFASPDAIRSEAGWVLERYGQGAGHVFNLGHGVSQHTPPEHVAALVEAVHDLSRRYH